MEEQSVSQTYAGFWQNLKVGKDIFKYGLILGGIELAIGIFLVNLFFIDTALAIIFLILVWRKRKVAN